MLNPGADLAGKVALVTGAGRMRSIGRSIAQRLADAGAAVAVSGTGRDSSVQLETERAAGWRGVDSVAAELTARGGAAMALRFDITDEAAVVAAFDEIEHQLGPVDVCVNNAAAARGPDRVPVVDTDLDAWEKVVAVNLRGTFLVSREAARRMLARRSPGAIVNISSVAGKTGPPRMAAYGASKAAVQSLTVSMARELASDGIRVNAVCPGVIATSRIDDVDEAGWARYVAATVPLGRVGSGDDIAEVVALLACERGGFITGQCWNVDGGQVVQR
ncbi:3-oxoacyl-[acyl-carrier protein] reductase/meso-butanediol dehydrogenase/(S,S)-butanediol dehydrogenase/diacetyl reductase [Branchiibius hedensis]|uniref:3-oxoacyl-[acyl-carrier protein] reductase n=1 Tax=Branchiibius hedensis TaxID=672460 RepID=A0A2Y9A113_9MICO|nr:SDR family oxidoreductase [Branchiibius hedensis]PWJ27056.1 3-oxoacyl-[acyl-carrier protein] reductase/meso-butanediol dehydrogenase/(S,S)-butanediol dehydrogenase/diacetyl reductase [Branchiibius hedensis]SSA35867.1 3-oxoacyl-[acyl-carrier protein] reductase [Branchiibius hedensis]